jgi:hypothetical protein
LTSSFKFDNFTKIPPLIQKIGPFKNDAFVESPKTLFSVIPAKAGIQEYQGLLDPGFRRGDDFDDFLRDRQE